MQGTIAGLAVVALLILPELVSAREAGVPRFDIARTCREARAYAVNEKDLAYRGCINDENEARQQLARKWRQFKPQDRSDCVAQGAVPMPSYVELLTCLEMTAEAKELLKPSGRSREAPAGAAVQGSSKPREAAPSEAAAAPAAPEPGEAAAPAPNETPATPAAPEPGGDTKTN